MAGGPIHATAGQSAPGAATLTTLYTVPAGTTFKATAITVCNRAAAATEFRIAVRPLGAAISNEHYLYYDVGIGPNETFVAELAITLTATDVVSVYNTLATLSFSLFGEAFV